MNASSALPLRRARAAVSAYFAVNAIAFSLWAARVPEIKTRLALSDARLGAALLAVALGALVAMQLAGHVAERVGSAMLTRVAGGLMPLSLAVLGYARTYVMLCAGLGLMGALSGALDVGMNARGVEVERAYGRPIFSSLHGIWSMSAAAGALLGAVLLQSGIATGGALAGPGIILAVATLPAALSLGADEVRENSASGTRDSDTVPRSGALWLLGALSFGALMAEGSAWDWSAVHLRDVLGARGGVLALGFAGFECAMTVGRLSGDRLVARVGRVRVLRASGAVACAGILVVASAHTAAVAVAGWVIAGSGIAHMVPQLFGAAGDRSPSAGRAIARVATVGYFGLLAGPPAVGALADATSLRVALLLPATMAALVGLLAGRAAHT